MIANEHDLRNFAEWSHEIERRAADEEVRHEAESGIAAIRAVFIAAAVEIAAALLAVGAWEAWKHWR